MSRRNFHSSKGEPAKQDAQPISGSSSTEPTTYKCPCEGENPDCIHCNGSGLTSRRVELRSSRTLSLGKTTNAPFRSKREKLFEVQISKELSHIKELYQRQADGSRVVFFNYLRRLATALDHPSPPGLLYFLHELWGDGDLESLASRRGGGSAAQVENLQIMARAAQACLAIVRSTAKKVKGKDGVRGQEQRLRQEKQQAQQNQQTQHLARYAAAERAHMVSCPYCGTLNYNQDQHNQLNHPELRTLPVGAKPPRPKIKAPPPSRPAVTPVATTRPAVAQKPHRSSPSTKRQSSPAPALTKNIERSRADTAPVERAMDAKYVWGGSFRDTNGTFGSHPLHDSMDDESNAG